jgi:hypothetical protein
MLMDAARYELLAGPRLAADQHGGGGASGDFSRQVDRRSERSSAADEAKGRCGDG